MYVEVALDIEIAIDGVVLPEWCNSFLDHLLRVKAELFTTFLMQVPSNHQSIEHF